MVQKKTHRTIVGLISTFINYPPLKTHRPIVGLISTFINYPPVKNHRTIVGLISTISCNSTFINYSPLNMHMALYESVSISFKATVYMVRGKSNRSQTKCAVSFNGEVENPF